MEETTISELRQPRQRYEILERIDAGGMAEVFKGKSISMEGFERLVAIKRVLPSLVENQKFRSMFLDEAKLSLTLNHANVVQVFDLGRAGETYFIVMEFVEGTDLKKILESLSRDQQRLPIALAVYIIQEVCKGLAHAHQKRDLQGRYLGIVHRDVSPPNVLISTEGEIKLTDFGLAKARSQMEVTDPGVVKGKFAYLSPEAAFGEEVDPAADIFACGILLWEMLTGRRLFLGETDLKTLELVRKAEMPPLAPINPEVPNELESIVRKALARDKKDRYASAQELGRELSEFLFSHGLRVTAYDLSTLVRQVIKRTRQQRQGKSTEQVKSMVQHEIDRIIRIEQDSMELGQADLVDASGASPSDASPPVATVMEDPRTWDELAGLADFDIAGEDPTQQMASPFGDQPAPSPTNGGTAAPPASPTPTPGNSAPGSAASQRPASRPSPPPASKTAAGATADAEPSEGDEASVPARSLRPLVFVGLAVILVLAAVLAYLLMS